MIKIKSTIVSAYSCEPNKGSEPGIGWNWVIELARLNYEVHVITRANNQSNIEKGLASLEPLNNLYFYYYDLSKWKRSLKKLPFGVYFYYFFWQIGILEVARTIIRNHKIDVIHHLTFGVFRQPSFLYKLNKPFVFGPVGGGETASYQLLKSLRFKDYLVELTRLSVNYVFRLSPMLNRMYNNTDIILCKTQDTLEFIPQKYASNKYIEMDIGSLGEVKTLEEKTTNKKLKVLYVGRFLGWKGVHLSIDAINKVNKHSDLVEFTLIGKGPLKKYLKNKAKSKSINFIDWVAQDELFKYYASHDCFLFPSFHDSSGSVILEAYSYGLPVICLNIGGPNKLVESSCGFKIKVKSKSVKQITDEIAERILELNNNRSKLINLSSEAFKRAKYYEWNNIVKRAYNLIEEKLN